MDIYSIIDAAMILEQQGHIESGDEEPSPPPVLIASARVMSALYRSIMCKKQPLIKSTPAQRAAFAQLQQRAIVPFTHIQDYDDYEAIRPQRQKAKPRASTAGPSRAGRQHRKGSWMDITKRMLESEAPIPGGSLSIPHATARITLAAPPSVEEGIDADASAPPASKDDDEEYIPDEEEIIPVTRQHHPAHDANDEFVPPPIPKIRPISVALGILPAAAQHGFRYIVSSGDKWRGQVGYNGDSGQRKLYTAYVPSAEQAARDVDQLMYKIRGRAYVPNLPMSDEEKVRLDGMTLHEVLATFQGQKNPTGGIALANLRNSRIVAAAIANGESPDLVMSAPPRARPPRSRPRSARPSKMDEFTDEDDDEGYGRGRGRGKGKGKGKGRGYGARARVVGITLNTGLVERQLAVAIRAPHGIPDAYKEAMGAMAMEETSAAVAQGASLDQIQVIGAAVTAALTLHQQHKAAIESGLKPEPQIQQMKPLALENGEGATAGAVAGEGPGGEDDALALASALASALSGGAPPPPAAAAGAEIDPTTAATAHATAHAAQPSEGSSDDLVQALIDLLKPGCLDSQLPPNLTLPGMNVPDSHHLVNSLRDTLRKAIDPSGPSSSIVDSSPQPRPPLSSRAHVPLGELMAHHVPKASTMVAVRDQPAEDDIEALYRERPQPPVRQQPLAHLGPAAAQAPAVGAGSRAHLSRRSAVACAKVIANGGFGYCPPSPQAKGREKRAAQDPDFYYQPLPPTVPAVAPATWGVEDSLVATAATAPAAAGDKQGGGAEGMRKKARKAARPAPAAEGGGFGSSLNDPAHVPPAPASVGRGAAMTRARPTRAPGSGSGGKAKSSGGTDKTSWRNAHKSHVGTPPFEALDEHGNPFKYIVHIGKKWRAQIGFRIDGANRKIYSNYVESAREAAKDADVMLYKLRGTREGNFLITDDEARAIDKMNLAQVMQMVRDGKNFPPPPSGIMQVAAVGGGGGGGMGVGGGEGAADGSVFFDGSARRNKPSLTSAAGQVEEGVMGQMEQGRGGGFEAIQDVETSILEGFLLGIHDNDQDGQGEGGDPEGGLMGDDGDGDGWRMSKDELMCEIVVDEGPEGLEGEGREDDSLDLMLQ